MICRIVFFLRAIRSLPVLRGDRDYDWIGYQRFLSRSCRSIRFLCISKLHIILPVLYCLALTAGSKIQSTDAVLKTCHMRGD